MSASDLEPFLPDWIEAAAEEARSVALGMLRERGRGAVLVGVARVDAALEALLKAALAPPRGSESLFRTDRPLGSFGAKIALAARLGLIDGAVELSSRSTISGGYGMPSPTPPRRCGWRILPTATACGRASRWQGAIGSGSRCS